MQLKYIDASRKKEWEDLVKANPTSGFMQSFFWAEFKKLIGWEIFKIGIFGNNNKLLGGAIVAKYSHFKNKSFIYIPQGPVLPYSKKSSEKMFHKLISEIDNIASLNKGKLTSHLTIEPNLETLPSYFSRFKKAKYDQQPLKTLIIDLTLSKKEILQQMKAKGRYNIKVAQKHNVKVTTTSLSKGLKDFLKVYKTFVKKEKFEGKDKSYFEALAYVLPNKENAQFYFAKYQSQVLSVALVLYFGDTATFLFGASLAKHTNTMSPYLLQWEIIKRAKSLGYKYYDLYSLSPIEDINHPWYGFSVFKKKFGGKEVSYIGAYDFIYNRKLYKDYEDNYLS